MDIFTPMNPPDYDGNGINETPRENSVSFGDGYTQTSPDGLNCDEAEASYQWSSLPLAERDNLMKFYKDHIGQVFQWDMPDKSGVQKWKITKATSSVDGFQTYKVSFSLKRSFQL